MSRRLSISATLSAIVLSVVVAPSADARKPGPIPVDPACLASVAWAVNPAAEDLRLNGCRSPRALAAPNAEGWYVFDAPDGSRTEVHRDVSWNMRSRAVSFRLRYNGGGSMTFAYTISGGPVSNNVLKAGTFAVR